MKLATRITAIGLLVGGLLTSPNPSLLPPLLADDGFEAVIALRMDYDSSSATYCKVDGPAKGISKIKTTGSSQNVTENTAGDNPFREVNAGDVLEVDRTPLASPRQNDLAFVITWTDDSNVVVNPAVDWSGGYPFKYWRQTCGTTINDGWIDVSGATDAKVCVLIRQMTATAVEWRLEGKDNGVDAQPNVIYPGETSDCGPNGTLSSGYCRFTSGSATTFVGNQCVFIPEREAMVRVGVKVDTDDGGDTLTDAEQVTIKVTGRVRR